jgi:hypothetical protein
MFSFKFTFDKFDIDSLSFERAFFFDSFVERALFLDSSVERALSFDSSIERALFLDYSVKRALSLDSFLERALSLDFTSLTSSKKEQSFKFLKDLIQRINEHADSSDYAIILARTKKNKERKTRKT